MNKILVIDDEQDIIDIIKNYFTPHGYIVAEASNAEAGMTQLLEKPDIILLDIMMPGPSGLDFCNQVRECVVCPILFLSAKTDESSKLLGFAAGGDDYITKPFSMRELHARVEAHLRRETRPRNTTSRVWFGPLWLDCNRKECGVGEERLNFVKKEFEVVAFLTLHGGQVFSRERIYEQIWGYDAQGDAQTAVTEHIKRIRKKLSIYNLDGMIETVWGIGYRWKMH